MIFVWLRRALAWWARMIFAPDARDVARIDANRRCPVCGATRGRLRAIQSGAEVLCQHTCLVCGGVCYEATVVRVTPLVVHPAVARDDIERAEDASVRFAAAREQDAAARAKREAEERTH